MKSYIFITEEGITYQPDSESPEPDIENCQVIGFAEGNSPEEAFDNLIEENGYLLETSFDEVICFELKHRDYHKFAKGFSLSDKRR
ncbi:MAG: hypothetical protein QMD05_08780 [Candidatus Brocadiaceae bacterium]|nr:hypothetical protein [Candidatus Brocadiaceae bacterium]